jgi:hypothetical protein
MINGYLHKILDRLDRAGNIHAVALFFLRLRDLYLLPDLIRVCIGRLSFPLWWVKLIEHPLVKIEGVKGKWHECIKLSERDLYNSASHCRLRSFSPSYVCGPDTYTDPSRYMLGLTLIYWWKADSGIIKSGKMACT